MLSYIQRCKKCVETRDITVVDTFPVEYSDVGKFCCYRDSSRLDSLVLISKIVSQELLCALLMSAIIFVG